jgi:hypothetical protein
MVLTAPQPAAMINTRCGEMNMARLSDLVEMVSSVTGLPRNNVALFGRLAREAGFIAQGGRGFSAPDMTARDAACLLGALIASPTAKDTPKTLETITSKTSEVISVDVMPFLLSIEGFNDADPDDPFGEEKEAKPKRLKALSRKKLMDRHTTRRVVVVNDELGNREEEMTLPNSLSFLGEQHSFVDMIQSLLEAPKGATLSSLLETEQPLPVKVIVGSNIRPFFDLYYPSVSRGRDSAVAVRYAPVAEKPAFGGDFRTIRYVTAQTFDAVISALRH